MDEEYTYNNMKYAILDSIENSSQKENIETEIKGNIEKVSEEKDGIKIKEESYKKLFTLIPKLIICPICNKTHDYEGGTLNSGNAFEFKCDNDEALVGFWGNKKGKMNVYIYFPCREFSNNGENKWKIGFEDVILDEDRPIIKFNFSCKPYYYPAFRCSYTYCDQEYIRKYLHNCRLSRHYNDEFHTLDFQIGFEFDRKEFDSCINDNSDEPETKTNVQLENLATPIDTPVSINNKEYTIQQPVELTVPQNMSLKNRLLYCSPMQNIEYLKYCAIKNKTTIRWIVTIGGVYGAYKILSSQNTKLSIENIGSKCKEYFGFVFEPLKDKESLKKFLAVATSYSMTYFATKVILKNFAKQATTESEAELQNGISEIEKARKKDLLFPKMEELLPIAISILVIYLMNTSLDNKKIESLKLKAYDLFGDVAYKAEAFLDLAKSFIASKFNLDLSLQEDEEKFKKFSNLAIISIILLFLYGTKTSKCDNENGKMQSFINQLIRTTKTIAPSAFGVIVAILVENKIVKEEDFENITT